MAIITTKARPAARTVPDPRSRPQPEACRRRPESAAPARHG
ncbi:MULTISPECIES: hypothetical protein [Micrococcaceae]|nr:hypothetical protein [Pseudarthrobacter sp. GA104]